MKKILIFTISLLLLLTFGSCKSTNNSNNTKNEEITGNGFETDIDANLVAISVDSTNIKTNYAVGEKVDFSNLKVTAIYDDGFRREVKRYHIDESTYDLSKVGSYFVGVIYTEKEVTKKTSFVINVNNLLDNINYLIGITASNGDKEFGYLDALDVSDLVVQAYYKDGTKKTLQPNDYKLDTHNYDSSKRGNYEIVVNYSETYSSGTAKEIVNVQTCFFATVSLHLDSISFVSGTKEFLQYNEISTDDWKIKLKFTEGVNEIVDKGFKTDVLSVFENANTPKGNSRVNITYSYNGKTCQTFVTCKLLGTSAYLNAGSLDLISTSLSNNVVSPNFELLKGYSVISSTETCGTQSFARQISFDGDGSRTEKSIKMTLDQKALVQIVAQTDENSTLVLYDSFGNAIKQIELSTTLTRYTLDNLDSGTYYLWSSTQINVYFVSIFNK